MMDLSKNITQSLRLDLKAYTLDSLFLEALFLDSASNLPVLSLPLALSIRLAKTLNDRICSGPICILVHAHT